MLRAIAIAKPRYVLQHHPLNFVRRKFTTSRRGPQDSDELKMFTYAFCASCGTTWLLLQLFPSLLPMPFGKRSTNPEVAGPVMGNSFATRVKKFSRSVHPLVKGTQRVDIMVLPHNTPREDNISMTSMSELNFHLFGIYDGYNGIFTVKPLPELLDIVVQQKLSGLYAGGNPDPPSDLIDSAIKEAFQSTDKYFVDEITRLAMNLDTATYDAISRGPGDNTVVEPIPRIALDTFRTTSLPEAVSFLRAVQSGSCALMGIYNTSDRSLRVALTGNSSAVWGRRIPVRTSPDIGQGKGEGGHSGGTFNGATNAEQAYIYEAQQLTADQTVLNPEEAVRLSRLHPDEPDLLKDNRLLGRGVTRAFGDGPMKLALEVQRRLHEDFLCDEPHDECKTPPYLTAEPVITHKEGIQKGDFVVYASDGLWDCLGTEEVVGLVGKWLEENGTKEHVVTEDGDQREVMLPKPPVGALPGPAAAISGSAVSPTTDANSQTMEKSYAPSDLPVMYPADYEDKTVMYKHCRKEKRFVCEDDNVAAHLVRNALGGAHTELREALLQRPSVTKLRDDISIIVVFFD
ncbi:phosphatase 2C-like domain-containing protein [Flammula alnicola]|nr:phosphatase 2C-like domain-containing protein [Flammula alnicola]